MTDQNQGFSSSVEGTSISVERRALLHRKYNTQVRSQQVWVAQQPDCPREILSAILSNPGRDYWWPTRNAAVNNPNIPLHWLLYFLGTPRNLYSMPRGHVEFGDYASNPVLPRDVLEDVLEGRFRCRDGSFFEMAVWEIASLAANPNASPEMLQKIRTRYGTHRDDVRIAVG